MLQMHAETILKEAKSFPDKRGLEAHLDTIWALRRKEYSYREIADFLKERGVKTDYIAVYRLVVEGNPLLDYSDCHFLIGGIDYECRKGYPLRPFGAGLLIAIEKRIRILVLEGRERLDHTWCECQFRLSAVPNHCWLQLLCKNLTISWNPESPCHLEGRFGFELKFEGNLMAMVCRTYNLESEMLKLGTAVVKTTEFFKNDKSWMKAREQMKADWKSLVLSTHHKDRGDTDDDICDGHSKWFDEHSKGLTKQFQTHPMG